MFHCSPELWLFRVFLFDPLEAFPKNIRDLWKSEFRSFRNNICLGLFEEAKGISMRKEKGYVVNMAGNVSKKILR